MREIPLTQGKVALVDDEDYERVIHRKWDAQVLRKPNSERWYAVTRRKSGGRYIDRTSLHRMVMGLVAGDKLMVDHRDGNGLDCRRSNLRICGPSGNARNRKKSIGSSVYKGVRLDKRRGVWTAQIKVDYRALYLGSFSDQKDAARAYDAAARKHHGEFALTNFKEVV